MYPEHTHVHICAHRCTRSRSVYRLLSASFHAHIECPSKAHPPPSPCALHCQRDKDTTGPGDVPMPAPGTAEIPTLESGKPGVKVELGGCFLAPGKLICLFVLSFLTCARGMAKPESWGRCRDYMR